ncbi:MAG: ATPase domain-containing protein [archaeon]
MENSQKIKLLEVFGKSLTNMSPLNFQNHIVNGKNDFSAWVLRSTGDVELSKVIDSCITKESTIDAINKSLALLRDGQVEKTALQTQAAVPQQSPIPNESPAVLQQPSVSIPQQVNVQKAKLLEIFVKSLTNMNDTAFANHITNGKNDFGAWVNRSIADKALADLIEPVTDKVGIINALNVKINEYRRTPEMPAIAMKPQNETPIAQVSPASPPEIKPLQAPAQLQPESAIQKPQQTQPMQPPVQPQTILPLKTEQISKPIVHAANATQTTQSQTVGIVAPPVAQPLEKPTISPVEKPKSDDRRNYYLRELAPDKYFRFANGQIIKSLPELPRILLHIDDNIYYNHVNQYKNDFAAWIFHAIDDKELAESIGNVKDKITLIDKIASRISSLKYDVNKIAGNAENPALQMQKVNGAQKPIAQSAIPSTAPIVSTAVKFSPEVNLKDKVHEDVAKKEELSPKDLFYRLKAQKEGKPASASLQDTAVSAHLSQGKADEISAKDLFNKLKAQKEGKLVDSKIVDSGKPVLDILSMEVSEILKHLKLFDANSKYSAKEEVVITEKTAKKRIFTGVSGFDEMISNGIPCGNCILLSGGPGSGKTTFTIQMMGWAAERGEKCLFMTFEESEENLIMHMEEYGLNPRKYIEDGTLMIVRKDPFKISRKVEALLAHARGELMINIDDVIDIIPKGFNPDRVIIDSLSAISAAFSDSSTAYRVYVTQLIDILQKTGATSFLITEVQGIENIGHGLVEEFLADGVIVFYNLQKGNIKQSALEILKMRATSHEKKIVPFEFVSGRGLVVYPLEKIFM